MKIFFLLSAFSTFILSAGDCSKKKTVYKGRLEIKGICSNHTIKLLDGKMDTSAIMSTWKDESSGKTHTNVFGLRNPCVFPGEIKEGEEFYFVTDTVAPEVCLICQAYYPTPSRKLIIKVVKK